jgi:hypothetical protein
VAKADMLLTAKKSPVPSPVGLVVKNRLKIFPSQAEGKVSDIS